MANNFLFSASSTGSTIQFPTFSIKLDTDNYYLWKCTVFSALKAFELDSLVTSDITPPLIIVVALTDSNLDPQPTSNPEYET